MNRIFSIRKDNISFTMSRLMRYIHLSHKYNWHHIIDTIIQLYRIVGLGIKRK